MDSPIRLHDELAVGRQKLNSVFRNSSPRIIKAGESIVTAGSLDSSIYHLRAGWACQFRDLSNGRRVIIDVYLPGDVIGLDAILRTRSTAEVLTLTSATVERIQASDGLVKLMACHSTALYIVRLLGERQRRADRLLTAISCLDARGRLAMMVLDFYTRLRRKKLITGLAYNLPLTQVQIGSYLGLTVVHVNRVLRSLRDERVVHLEKHCATILDLDRLTGLAQYGNAVSTAPGVGISAFNEVARSNSQAAE